MSAFEDARDLVPVDEPVHVGDVLVLEADWTNHNPWAEVDEAQRVDELRVALYQGLLEQGLEVEILRVASGVIPDYAADDVFARVWVRVLSITSPVVNPDGTTTYQEAGFVQLVALTVAVLVAVGVASWGISRVQHEANVAEGKIEPPNPDALDNLAAVVHDLTRPQVLAIVGVLILWRLVK